MPIKTLESYLFDNYALTNYQVEILRYSKLGIDVDHYLSRLISGRRESTLEGLGGYPITLNQLIEQDLKVLRELEVTPVFVSTGLRITQQFQVLQNPELLPSERYHRKVWDRIASGQSYRDSFREPNTPPDTRPLKQQLFEFLTQHDVEFLVAPYSAWMQLVYMHSAGVIDVILGPTDLLLVDKLDKFIFDLDLQTNREFKALDKHHVLNRLNLTDRQFRDIAVTVGFDLQPEPLPVFSLMPNAMPNALPPPPTFRNLHEYVLTGASVYNMLLSLPVLMEKFQKGVAAIEYCPVLKMSGSVEPIPEETIPASNVDNESPDETEPTPNPSSNSSATDMEPTKFITRLRSDVPNDLHEFIGQRLADEVFFYQSVGINLTALYETIIFGTLIERLPLDGVSTPTYVKLVTDKQRLEMKGQLLNLVTGIMNRYYQVKRLKLTTYFQGEKSYDLVHRIQPPVFLKVNTLFVKDDDLKGEGSILQRVFASVSNDFLAKSTEKEQEKRLHISSDSELIATSVVRALVLQGYVSAKPYALTKWGELLPLMAGSKHAEQLFLVANYFKVFQQTIQPSDFTVANEMIGTPDSPAKDAAILICKLCSLISIAEQKGYHTRHHYRSILQTRCLFDKLQGDASESVNVNLLSIVLGNSEDANKYNRNNDDWRRLATSIPFAKSLPNISIGLIMQFFFTSYLRTRDAETHSVAVAKSKNLLSETFRSTTSDTTAVLISGLTFFKEVLVVLDEIVARGLIVKTAEFKALLGEAASLIGQTLEALQPN